MSHERNRLFLACLKMPSKSMKVPQQYRTASLQ